jgi:hypothetical protein
MKKATPDYPVVDNRTRHVLVVEDDGMTYLEGHTDDIEYFDECARVSQAWQHFYTQVSYPDIDKGPLLDAPIPRPGRYWCSAADDGNFEIGAEVAS